MVTSWLVILLYTPRVTMNKYITWAEKQVTVKIWRTCRKTYSIDALSIMNLTLTGSCTMRNRHSTAWPVTRSLQEFDIDTMMLSRQGSNPCLLFARSVLVRKVWWENISQTAMSYSCLHVGYWVLVCTNNHSTLFTFQPILLDLQSYNRFSSYDHSPR
jgi:hypothetical protein